ncbi:MAG: 2Fe-2S iron-sulfur cluster-binding protein [Bdellovibrio sp.]
MSEIQTKAEIRFLRIQRPSFQVKAGENLLLALLQAGIPVASSCQGKGICGKCSLRVEGSSLPLLEEHESLLLEKQGAPEGFRLSCQLQVPAEGCGVDAPYW